MKIIAREKSTLLLSPSVSVALSMMPCNRFHRASDAFSIPSKSNEAKLDGISVILIQNFLRKQRMGLAMSQIPATTVLPMYFDCIV